MTSLKLETFKMSKMSVLDLEGHVGLREEPIALAAISRPRGLPEERADAMDYYLGDMRKDMPAQSCKTAARARSRPMSPTPSRACCRI